MSHSRAEIITIGDEILYGQILDSNSQWISQELDQLGIRVVRQTTVGDIEGDILHAFKEAEQHADLVLITGGLGPTNDDLTKPLLARYFGADIQLNKEALEEVRALFKKFGKELTETNKQQAELPVNCEKITNKLGSAPGMWFNENDTVFISMPGVPHEMKGMMTDVLLPRIRSEFHTLSIYHKVVKTSGIGESWLSDKIKPWESQLPDHIKLAYLPSVLEVKLRLTASGLDRNQLKADVDDEIEKLIPYINKYIFGYNKDTIESVVGQKLQDMALTISTAESCTGGFLAHKITSVAGSSAYFIGSIISYNNRIKEEILNVSKDTLSTFGAVSEETVKEMAVNVRNQFKTDMGVATSGIAGPGGGTEEKPVGTVWIAVSDSNGIETRKLSLAKNRLVNIEASTKAALSLVLQRLMKIN